MSSLLKRFLLAFLLVWGSSSLSAQTAEAQYKLIGDVYQTLQFPGINWTNDPTPLWTLSADMRHEFSLGQVSFIADATVNVPLASALAAGNITANVYEAYLRITPVDGLDFTAGQKRLNIGVGQTFTIGDTINPSVGFFDQKTGFRGLTASWSPTSWLGWTAGVSGERNLGSDRWNPTSNATSFNMDRLGAATQVSVLLDKVQAMTSLVYSPNRTFNPAVGISYDLGGFILTGEGAAEFLPQGLRPASSSPTTWTAPDAWTAPRLSGSVGARYTFTVFETDFTASAEYLYWGQGWSPDEVNNWKTWYANPATKTLATSLRNLLPLRGVQNGFFKFQASLADAFSLGSLFVVDFQDPSTLGQVSLTILPWEGLDLTVAGTTSWGASGDAWEKFMAPSSSGTPTSLQYLLSFQTKYHF